MSKKLYTIGIAPFAGGRKTLKSYVNSGRLGPVSRIADSNNTPVLTPSQVTRANKLFHERPRRSTRTER